MSRFEWDEDKNLANRRKHGIDRTSHLYDPERCADLRQAHERNDEALERVYLVAGF